MGGVSGAAETSLLITIPSLSQITATKQTLVFVFVTQSCLTLCNSMDYSLLGSSVHEIFQAEILEWVAISFLTKVLNPGLPTL